MAPALRLFLLRRLHNVPEWDMVSGFNDRAARRALGVAMTLGDTVVCAHCKRAGGPFVLVERALVHPECRGAWAAQALCQSVRRLFTPEGMLEAVRRAPRPNDLEFP